MMGNPIGLPIILNQFFKLRNIDVDELIISLLPQQFIYR